MALLTHFFEWLSKLLKALWLFLAGLIAVGAIYYLLTGVEQGIDVVIQSGEVLDSAVLSVMAVCLWSFLLWYSSRTLSYIKQHRDDQIFSRRGDANIVPSLLYEKYGIPSGFYRHMPRLLAYNCFVSIQAAIFHLPTFFAWSGTRMLAVIVLHNLLYFILIRRFENGPSSGWRKFYSLLVFMVIAFRRLK